MPVNDLMIGILPHGQSKVQSQMPFDFFISNHYSVLTNPQKV